MAKKKTLLEKWRAKAYNEQADKEKLQKLWVAYFQKEKEIYQELLKNPDEEVKGTVKELADKYKVDVMTMTGFLDGINDSLKEANPIETMEEETEVSLAFDKELLYKNMVAAEADWLYNLEEWDAIYGLPHSPRCGQSFLFLRRGSPPTFRQTAPAGRRCKLPPGQ